MKKDFENNFIQNCQKGTVEAKNVIQLLNEDEIIELRANLKVEEIHNDRIVLLFIPFITSVISALSLFGDMTNVNKDNIAIIGYGLLIVELIAISLYGWFKCKFISTRVRALSYLEDYSQKQAEKIEITSNYSPETFEQITSRQKQEIEQLLIEWENKQNYASTQITLIKESLSENKSNS